MANVVFLWHMHQPYYVDPTTRTALMPWVRLHSVKGYLDMVSVLEEFPGIRVIPYGHMGDGNIHFNLLPATGVENSAFLEQTEAIMDAVNEVVRQLDGSFSAEHGIGRVKPYMMEKWRGGAELATMRRIKAALDPLGIMNPGKVLPSGPML